MAELQTKLETGSAPVSTPVVAEAPSKDAVDHNKAVETTTAEDSKALVVVAEPEKAPVPAKEPTSGRSLDRDIALAEVAKEKKLSYVRAWEDSEKAKVENRAQKHLSAVTVWENSKKAALEADLKKIEEQLEKKKAEYAEKMKNKMALIHKEAEEKRAVVEAKRGEAVWKVEDMAAKYRATGTTPKKTIGCF